MAEKIGEIELDLREVVLEGFQEYYCPLNVKALRVGGELGYQLPRVDVVKKNGVYRLVFGPAWDSEKEYNYGGHSRSRLALEDGILLSCDIFNNHRECPRNLIYRPIEEIQAKIRGRAVEFQLRRTLEYLPKEIMEKFIMENDLVLTDDDILMTGENFRNPPPF